MKKHDYEIDDLGQKRFSSLLASVFNGTEPPSFLYENKVKISKVFLNNFIDSYIKDEEYEKCHIVDTFCKKYPELISETEEEERAFFMCFLKKVK